MHGGAVERADSPRGKRAPDDCGSSWEHAIRPCERPTAERGPFQGVKPGVSRVLAAGEAVPKRPHAGE